MGLILLVRHGRASWGSDDYDVLSPAGVEQSALTGRALAGLEPDLVVHGTLRRQVDTATALVQAAGWSSPAVAVDVRWNEMDHHELLARVPRPFDDEPSRGEFQAWFEAATDRWLSGEHDEDYAEPFPRFRRRVEAALAELAGVGTAVVVTSGGPVSWVTASLLAAGTPTYARLAPVVVNGSVSRVVSGRRGLTLVSFNDHQHLPAELRTYR